MAVLGYLPGRRLLCLTGYLGSETKVDVVPGIADVDMPRIADGDKVPRIATMQMY